MLTPLLFLGAGIGLVLFLKNRKETGPIPPSELQPGMVGLLGGTKMFGMVVLRQSGILGWTNVQPADNARIRSEFPNGTRVLIKVGDRDAHAVANNDGAQGGRFFQAI